MGGRWEAGQRWRGGGLARGGCGVSAVNSVGRLEMGRRVTPLPQLHDPPAHVHGQREGSSVFREPPPAPRSFGGPFGWGSRAQGPPLNRWLLDGPVRARLGRTGILGEHVLTAPPQDGVSQGPSLLPCLQGVLQEPGDLTSLPAPSPLLPAHLSPWPVSVWAPTSLHPGARLGPQFPVVLRVKLRPHQPVCLGPPVPAGWSGPRSVRPSPILPGPPTSPC